ncbi:MAG: DUF1653 domain-containing protein [Lachnospiraceae bacterium]|nr:DUF1653 domain-containing protein [Lachnospiraceae bacterium]
MNTILPGQIYRHFKGNEYEVICVARHTESEEDLVIYRSVKNPDAIYARPMEMFTSEVDKDKYPEAGQELRFEPVSGDNNATTANKQTDDKNSSFESEFINAGSEQIPGIDPGVLAFLDTDDFEKKFNILSDMHGRVDESMLNTMAFSVDFEFNEGSVEDKYNELLNCISLRAKFECSRLR